MKVKDIPPFGYRAQPPEVLEAVRKVAQQSGRSMNSQVNQYVLRGLRKDKVAIPKPKKDDAPGARTPEASVQAPPTVKSKGQRE